jgi:hypothetical protein
VRLQDRRGNLVVFRHGAVHSEYYRILLRRKIRSAYRALHALNTHMGPVNHVRHDSDGITKKATIGAMVSKDRRRAGADGRARSQGRHPKKKLHFGASKVGD